MLLRRGWGAVARAGSGAARPYPPPGPLAVAGARGRGWRRDRRLRRPERDDGARRQAVVIVQEREREAGDRLGHRCRRPRCAGCEHLERAPVLQRKGRPGVGMDVVAQHDQAVDLAARQIAHVAAGGRERGRRRDLAHAHRPAEQPDVAHERARLGGRARALLLGGRRLRPARADRRRVAVRAVDLGRAPNAIARPVPCGAAPGATTVTASADARTGGSPGGQRKSGRARTPQRQSPPQRVPTTKRPHNRTFGPPMPSSNRMMPRFGAGAVEGTSPGVAAALKPKRLLSTTMARSSSTPNEPCQRP